MPVAYSKICPICQCGFPSDRVSQVYCSTKCRSKARNWPKKMLLVMIQKATTGMTATHRMSPAERRMKLGMNLPEAAENMTVEQFLTSDNPAIRECAELGLEHARKFELEQQRKQMDAEIASKEKTEGQADSNNGNLSNNSDSDSDEQEYIPILDL